MIGRREFGIVGLSALTLAAMHRSSEGAEPAASRKTALDKCAEACSKCQRACDACGRHCATRIGEGKSHHMATLRSCLDCADVCSAASRIVARDGVYNSQICTTCAEVCAKCASECEKHGDDAIMKECAEQCRACEKACREMLK